MTRRPLALAVLFLACTLLSSPVWAQGGSGQPPIFTYVSQWGVPRAQWADQERAEAENKPILDALVADGTLIGYGSFENRIHSDGGYTHGDWFQAKSVGNILKALEKFYAQPARVTSPVQAASKHEDLLMVSTVYGARAVTDATGYLRVVSAEIMPGHEEAFLATYRQAIVPIFDKLVADGAIISYQLDMEFNIQNAPGRFFSAVVARDADALDKIRLAVQDMFAKNPTVPGAFAALTVPNSRRDILARATGVTRK